MAPPPLTAAMPGTAAVPQTGSINPLQLQKGRIAEGTFTKVIYGLIKDESYAEAAAILGEQLSQFPDNRAALSLLAFCQSALGDFLGAAAHYERLSRLWPGVEDYKYHYVQSMYKAGALPEALRAAQSLPAD